MKNYYLLLASTALMMAGCANDDLSGSAPTPQSANQAIAFNLKTPTTSRADGDATGATAAGKLHNMFIVWGEKNESSGTAATDTNTVFKNYVVKYTDGSANTSTTNSSGWEYVGIDHSDFDTNVKTTIGSGKAQTIKYWDNNASNYVFTAVSALQSDIKAGNVIIEKTTGEDGKTVYDKGYTIDVKSQATPGAIYYADRKVETKTGTSGSETYANSPVTLTFRNFQSKVRFAIYEDIEGYSVEINSVKYTSNTEDASNPSTDNKNFQIDGDFVVAGENTKYTVTYDNASTKSENKARVAVDGNPSKAKSLQGGTSILLAKKIGTTAANATYDNETTSDNKKNYTSILPNPSNKTPLKLTISYTLTSEDGSGETISKTDQTVEVPVEYCQWKSNYAYTYIFKITSKGAGLYPITFDACVAQDEVGDTQETVTTVSAPSITTYVNGTATNDYAAGNVIYASVRESATTDGAATTLSVADGSKNIALYTVETEDASVYPITEESVAYALAQTSEVTGAKIKATPVTISETAPADTESENAVLVNSVPTADGNTISISALKWTAQSGKVYAVEYTKTDNGTTTKTYKIVKIGGATGQKKTNDQTD